MPKYKILYKDSLYDDIEEAINWYDAISHDLGDKFLIHYDKAEAQIIANPLASAHLGKTSFRRIIIEDFPYKIIYMVEKETIYLITVVHSSRSNKFIKRKLK